MRGHFGINSWWLNSFWTTTTTTNCRDDRKTERTSPQKSDKATVHRTKDLRSRFRNALPIRAIRQVTMEVLIHVVRECSHCAVTHYGVPYARVRAAEHCIKIKT